MKFSCGKPKTNQSVQGQCEHSQQQLIIDKSVLSHFGKYRQLTPWDLEAGGQLFGNVSSNEIFVKAAVGPYAGDERFRNRYRSKPAAAQNAIDGASARGLLYLGEWHTHAEDHPIVSTVDLDAMNRLIASSDLNSNSLLLIIVGRTVDSSGLSAWTISRSNKFPWRLSVKNG